MNYRHIYHAGGFADVFKHTVLMLVLEYLRQKDKPFFVLDTHAGTGLYDLQSAEASKTAESATGILKIMGRQGMPEEIERYVKLVRSLNTDKKLRFYPGSPSVVKKLLRAADRFVAAELHPDDTRTLRRTLGNDRRIRVEEEQDGYTMIRARLPPHERRGLVLVDPPFEEKGEFDRMLDGLKEGYKRWPTGIYMFWYPVKDTKETNAFHHSLKQTGIPDIMAIDFLIQKPNDPSLLNGCGLALVNPPWTLAAQLGTIMPWLVRALTAGRGSFEIKKLTEE